jgi:hypothetical protein
MSDKEKEIIKRAVEIDGYIPSCYRRRETAADMWDCVAIMHNCRQLLRSEKDDKKLITHIKKSNIPISKQIIDYLKERSEENEERAYIYMQTVLRADYFELAQLEYGVSYEITREMYYFAVELHALK